MLQVRAYKDIIRGELYTVEQVSLKKSRHTSQKSEKFYLKKLAE